MNTLIDEMDQRLRDFQVDIYEIAEREHGAVKIQYQSLTDNVEQKIRMISEELEKFQ